MRWTEKLLTLKRKKEEILTFILFHSFEVLFNIDRY